MAEIKLTVGALEANVISSDENAIRILQGALAGAGYDTSALTGQEQATAVITVIVGHIQELAKQAEMQQAIIDAKAQVVALRDELADAEAFVSVAGVPVANDPPLWEG